MKYDPSETKTEANGVKMSKLGFCRNNPFFYNLRTAVMLLVKVFFPN